MKKFMSMLAIALVFASCSSDDDNADDTNVSAEGVYDLTFFGGETGVDINGDGSASANLLIETGCYADDTMILAAGGVGAFFNSSSADIEIIIETGTTDSVSYMVSCDEENETITNSWTQDGDQVAVTSDGETFTATLSANTISFVIPNGSFIEVVEGEGTATLIEDLTLTYTKR